ncbi:hypothetical protein RSK20926_00465 [Roseobacter sp. SK209-2-6]|nr:hypothetical protein RSK20926_00465 [Roseobacter sp. SK209-2-6]
MARRPGGPASGLGPTGKAQAEGRFRNEL